MEKFDYKTTGTCAQVIHFERDDDKRIHNISFEGGCNGNLKAVSKLCEGMTAEEISAKLLGNLCRDKGTSCADQLAKAVMSVY
ncbi:TIGR03905 family TSCPD domain-containing protein [Treponema sp.]|uniref:TIGR03905 family TSCPD domain-containing protein n=1 Tax=Treponema sp. TaxID=166 RepID=UPI001D886880|nr:TIGR03905 family TSCPD domain-containing protein [Treponema sp.]MBS7242445.1 TIGR03905 family TSCPD domain-containing protein [Treponema sp.]MCI6442136.1 TIGR03905 family TSCPD domain-containing protein [Spirochaetia bacterium]MDY4133361.1 TIGR03905 family TSCPD domain-containing protein [Treponema sp.]